jgi:hypothetical protein
MRYVMLLVFALAGCAAPQYRGAVNDPPDTTHTNSGGVYFDHDGRMHTRPAYVVDNETPEQHEAARKAHDAYYVKVNAERKAMLHAMTPQQRHAYICNSLAEDIHTAAGLPPVSPADPTFTDPLILYRKEGCD